MGIRAKGFKYFVFSVLQGLGFLVVQGKECRI